MQSMNQSLLALLAHGTITYQEAMTQSSDPEDLSLKLRKMFPQIEERGGDMTATSDFSQILELQEFRRLYEEQEEKVKSRLGQKDEEIGQLQRAIKERDAQLQQLQERLKEAAEERDRMKSDYAPAAPGGGGEGDKLMERIKELNQKLMGNDRRSPAASSVSPDSS